MEATRPLSKPLAALGAFPSGLAEVHVIVPEAALNGFSSASWLLSAPKNEGIRRKLLTVLVTS